jgi:hypothetical protein
MTHDQPWKFESSTDVRVETSGDYTRGSTITDRRGFKKTAVGEVNAADTQLWLDTNSGNRVTIATESPGDTLKKFGEILLGQILL